MPAPCTSYMHASWTLFQSRPSLKPPVEEEVSEDAVMPDEGDKMDAAGDAIEYEILDESVADSLGARADKSREDA